MVASLAGIERLRDDSGVRLDPHRLQLVVPRSPVTSLASPAQSVYYQTLLTSESNFSNVLDGLFSPPMATMLFSSIPT